MSTAMVDTNRLIFMLRLQCLWAESALLGQQRIVAECSLGYEEEANH